MENINIKDVEDEIVYTYHIAYTYVDIRGNLATGMAILDLDFMVKTGDDIIALMKEIVKYLNDNNLSNENNAVILGWNLLEG